MNRRSTIAHVKDTQAIADSAEQIAQDLRRTVAAVKGVVDDFKVLHEALAPLVKWLWKR